MQGQSSLMTEQAHQGQACAAQRSGIVGPCFMATLLFFLFCFFFFFFLRFVHSTRDLRITWPGDWTRAPCLGAWSLNHWILGKSHGHTSSWGLLPPLLSLGLVPPTIHLSLPAPVYFISSPLLIPFSHLLPHQSLSGDFVCLMTVTITSTQMMPRSGNVLS